MVEELLPAFVSFMSEMDVGQRVMSGLDGLFDQFHSRELRCLAALFDVTRRAGTDNIFPCGFAAYAPGDNVVEG